MGKTQAALAANFGFPDPDFNDIFWHSSFTAPLGQLSINVPHLQLDTLDTQLDEGRVNVIPQRRQDAYQRAVQMLNEDSAYVWLYRYTAALIANNSVRGLQRAELGGFTSITSKPWYTDLWLDRKEGRRSAARVVPWLIPDAHPRARGLPTSAVGLPRGVLR